MNTNKVINARKINKMRFILGMIICSIVIIMAGVALTLNLVNYFDLDTPEIGLGTYRMYTTIATIIAAVAAALCLPFQIDGLRRDRYNLPPWIVMLMYVGAVGEFLTFLMAASLISAYQGFTRTMFMRSNLFMHTINPILITLLFTVTISDTHIKFKRSFIPLIPLVIYMIIYGIMVFGVGQWRDHYHTNTFIPWPVTLILILVVSFGICQLLRYLHNLSNKYVSHKIEVYYKQSPDYEYPKVSNAITHLAELASKFYHEGDDIYIPVDIIHLLSERYGAGIVPVDILYDIYLEQYLISIGKKSSK